MDLQLKDKTALVTGASRGIGLAVVEQLVEEGVRVVAAARTSTADLRRTGASVVQVDLTEQDGPDRLVAAALHEVGELDLLVNNVGGGDGDATAGFLEFGDDGWRQVFELNYFATVRTTRAALPSLVRQRGAIVNVSSNGARLPSGGPIAYTTAKAALTAFGKALAEEFGPQGVRVNTVSPGPVRTALWEDPAAYGGQLAEKLGIPHEHLLAALPQQTGMLTGRLIEPAEVADLIVQLCSPRAASIMGADYLIDAGIIKTA
ncbi:NAD(P)-dependent dehydrogenase (short-subunit alcohol dehydrogenase family) [Kribbella sp. VKM Ac-2527]|uniref:NAD(P)-dependent dehydrogenase (Short-subunit alcohol dehydrogenase family) n=1 Tax=Kribbella caucasensis TaxID=2512215 RepID=A0A4V3C8W3_9ACTN|nr:SDR family NAD(P)-dependent oxidoreductase [Kribbella sp. VKM Ac-2527]TDO43178.1 NAD(P)-dependent dehydrogenase (short-subunit alcohol dehydrogenase family) [Kribbella sp. VKM Ac-2527]